MNDKPVGGAGMSDVKAQTRRFVAGPTKRVWRSVRRHVPDRYAEPVRSAVRSVLRSAGMLDPPAAPADASRDGSVAPVRSEVAAPAAFTEPADRPSGGLSAPDQKPIVFFHVMKCGGTSVREGLLSAVGQRTGPKIFELDGEAAKTAAGGQDPDNWAFRDALLPYVLLASEPAIVLGHFRYRDRYHELLDTAHFVTVLRDPVERLVSLYKYRRYKDGVDVPVSAGFEDFLATPRWAKEGGNYATTFCGRSDLEPGSDEAVAAAVANLRRFAVVGCVERLGEFAQQLTARFGLDVTFPFYNRSPAPEVAESQAIEAAVLQRAREICAPDLQVYEQVIPTPV